MTIKQAAKFLEEAGKPFSPITIRKAVTSGRLAATKHTVPTEYYLIEESDLLAWAADVKLHTPGRPKPVK
jgi:hypothetical protein